MRTIETQFRQYHVTKVGARHIGEPNDHKSGGEPLGPMGVYAYVYILALEMASRGNQHCANCIGTLSFPITAQRTAANAGSAALSAAVEG